MTANLMIKHGKHDVRLFIHVFHFIKHNITTLFVLCYSILVAILHRAFHIISQHQKEERPHFTASFPTTN